MTQTKYVTLLETSRKGLSGTNVIRKDGSVLVQIAGEHAFTTTGTNVEIDITDENDQSMGIATADVIAVIAMQKDGSPTDTETFSSDNAVTSNAITLFRSAGTTSALEFNYIVIAKVAQKYLR